VFISKYDKVVKPRSEIIRVGMSRPFDMMFRELIVAALGLYGEFIYRRRNDADDARGIDLWYPICELYPPLDNNIQLTCTALLHRLPPHLPRNSRLVTYVFPLSSDVRMLMTQPESEV
jgi:hypothetical protein